jgi:ribosomal protein S18 acetylase RimI-like enzyme
MGNNLMIRNCEERDLPDVKNLMGQLGEVAHFTSEFSLERIREISREMSRAPEVYLNLVGEDNGRTIGFISLIFYKTFFHYGGTALINELIVDVKMRGLGVGQKLIDAAINEAKKHGMDEIEVGTEKNNLKAQHFYQKAGFDEEYFLLGMEF